MKEHQRSWRETWDADDNSIWEAPSPYSHEKYLSKFYWRLKQRIVDNRIEWFEAHDPGLIASSGRESWPTLRAAKAAIALAHANIIQECDNA